jgi:hypothetical protein
LLAFSLSAPLMPRAGSIALDEYFDKNKFRSYSGLKDGQVFRILGFLDFDAGSTARFRATR